MKGYEALRTGAAWLDLTDRGAIFATGEDRARLLHALTTNHVQQLKPGEGCYAFFLNAQGRIQADVNILCLPESFLLDTEPEVREKVFAHLDHYIIADDVTLDDATDRIATIGIEGPNADEVMKTLEAPMPEIESAHEMWDGTIVARLSVTGATGYRLFPPVEQKDDLVAKIELAGAVAAGREAVRVVRLENQKPRYGEDITETSLPQETKQQHALHFNKGCYLGQEIVERIRSRGHVNKFLVGLVVEGAADSGTKLTKDGAEVGEITSAAVSPALNSTVAMATVRAQFAVAGTELTAGEARAIVR